MRSKLFVPASRPELFTKALASQADALSFDLEDAVLSHRKDEARTQLLAFLESDEFLQSRALPHPKTIIVRVNAFDTPYFDDDLDAVCRDGVDVVNVPKIDSPEDALKNFDGIDRARAKNGRGAPVKVLVNIESPLALCNAAAIGLAHPDIWGLQLGLGDLFEPLNIARYNERNLHAALFALRMASAASGAMVYDGAYANVADSAGFRAEALMARNLGFMGKTCIHPSQVAVANEVFSPRPEEIEWSRKVLHAAQENQTDGAFLLEGKMIDAPFVVRAQSILDAAQRLALAI